MFLLGADIQFQMWKAKEQLSFLMIFKVSHWLIPQGWCLTSHHPHIRGATFCFRCAVEVRGQGTVWMHAGSHQRDLTWKRLGGPCTASVAPHRPVFLSGLSDYWYIPVGVNSIAPWPAAWKYARIWTGSGSCEDDVIAGSEIFLGRILPVSCSHTLLFVSQLSLRQFQHPDQLGLSHYIDVPLNFL